MIENDMETDAEQQQNGTIATSTYVRTGKPGHPSKYTPTAVRRLLAAIADSMTNKAACIAANIGVATLRDWRKEHPDLELRMEEAREKARQKALQRIKVAAQQGDWRADAEWLKLTFPQDYRRAQQPTTQHNTWQLAQQVILPPEEQQRLIEQRKRLYATKAHPEQLVRGTAGQQPSQTAEIIRQPDQPAGDAIEAEIVDQQQPQLEQQQRQPNKQATSSLYQAWANYQKPEDEEEADNNGPPRLL